MGNIQSLSKESQDVLDAASTGDAEWIKQQITSDPKLLASVTLLKRRSVLHLAAKSGHPDVITAVLEPLIEAVKKEYYAQQEVVKSTQEPQEQPQQLQSQLPPRPTAEAGQQAVPPPPTQQQAELQLLSFKKLRKTVNARDLYRRTPLIVAAKQGHLDCTQLLVEAAANLFAVDREGNTSLHYAALHGHGSVVEYLLRKASDRNLATRFVNKRNLSGFTPLHYAVWGCNEQLVQQLLHAGADVTHVNDRVFDAWVTVPVGSTALHLAVVRNSMPIALLLLQHYVLQVVAAPSDVPRPQDPRTIANLYGMNPAQLAAHRGLRQMSRVLMPTLSLARVLEVLEPDAARSYGPPSLKAIAATAMQAHLTQQLDKLEEQRRSEAAAAHVAAMKAEQQHKQDSIHSGQAMAADTAGCLVCGSSGGSSSGSCCCAVGTCCGGDTSCLLCVSEAHEAGSRQGPEQPGCEQLPPSLSPASSDDLADLEIIQELVPASPLAAKAAAAAAVAGGSSSSSMACRSGTDCGGVIERATSSGWYDDSCCVCWEEEVSVTIGPCMHALCLGCARQLVQNSGKTGATCPLCRRYIADFGLVPGAVGSKGLKLLSGAGI